MTDNPKDPLQGRQLDAHAWDRSWQDGPNPPADLKGVTPALVDWQRRHNVRWDRVLVPGCGAGHDAYFLAKRGANVVGVDFAQTALDAAAAKYRHPKLRWQLADVTQLPMQAVFDKVWEYTCFCALAPEKRVDYLVSIHRALQMDGLYFGMVFSKVPNPESGPPFQIEPGSFRDLLQRFFKLETFEEQTSRSVKPRRGCEIWFCARKITG